MTQCSREGERGGRERREREERERGDRERRQREERERGREKGERGYHN